MRKFELHCRWEEEITLDYRSSSLFHGVLMNAFADDYSQYLHQTSVTEFHQQLIFNKNSVVWTIYALTDRCAEHIQKDWFEKVDSFYLKQKSLSVAIISKSASKNRTYLDWYLERSNQQVQATRLKVEFLSPTSFKSYNSYLQDPSLSLCYRSLIMRLSVLQGTVQFPKKIWDHLAENTVILEQEMEKTQFPLEKTSIPSFKGEMVIELQGSKEDIQMMNLLWDFAEWAGIGVKTAIGMGAVNVTYINDN